MSDWRSNNKICATCGSWGGPRELAIVNQIARTPSSSARGKCLDRKGKYGIGELAQGNSCGKWQKWAPLK